MTAVRRIAELKRDDMPFIIRLQDGREFSVDSGGSVEIDVPANGGDRITVFDASEKQRISHSCRRYRQNFDPRRFG